VDPGQIESARHGGAGARDARPRRLAPQRLIGGLLVPVAAFIVLDDALHNELLALAIVELIPVFWALGYGFWHGRLDLIALAAAVVLLAALIVSIADGGSAMPLKLRRGLVTGTLGLACLASVASRRPLLPLAINLVERAWPGSARLARIARAYSDGPSAAVLTTIIGVTLLLDAAAQVTLALSVSTTVFLLTAKLARTVIFAAGLGVCWWYTRRALPERSRPVPAAPVSSRRRPRARA